jgi:hypothetical protein
MNPAISKQQWNEHSVRVGTKRVAMNVGTGINLIVGANLKVFYLGEMIKL